VEEARQHSAVINVVLSLLIATLLALNFSVHACIGWQTGIVRLPISVISFSELERDKSPKHFWGILLIDALVTVVAVCWGIWTIWRAV
jgi:hypothetical protein